MLSQASLHIDVCRKITKSQPRNERTHQIAKKSAEIFKKSRKVVRETSSSVTAYYSRASAGECSTSQYLSPECPGEAREKPGQAQKPQGASPQKSKFYHFSAPQVKIVRSIISSISMLAALTVASPGLMTYRCFRKNYQISASQRTNTSDCKKIR